MSKVHKCFHFRRYFRRSHRSLLIILHYVYVFQEAFFGAEILDRTKTQEGQSAFQAAADTELPEEATIAAEVKSTIDTSADNIVFQPAPVSPKPPSPKPAPTLPPPASQDDSDKEPHLGAT